MSIAYGFATASRIVFGRGRLRELPELLQGYGSRVLLVTGAHPERSRSAASLLERAGRQVETLSMGGEPTVDAVMEAASRARAFRADAVVAMGGGSVLDSGKAVSALLTNHADLMDYLEVIGRGQPLEQPAAPCVAIPTTAGTGSEVTKNAVLKSRDHGVKVSLRHESMIPNVALCDPDLTMDLPAELTASTGLDALTQLVEAFLTPEANPLTDGLCREGLRLAAAALPRAVRGGSGLDTRERMMQAALLGGMALANAGLGCVHGIAGPLGGMVDIPHGMACALLLPHGLRINREALASRDPQAPALQRMDELGLLLTGGQQAGAKAALAWLDDLYGCLELGTLSDYGLTETQVPELTRKALKSSSMKGNPVDLTADELQALIREAL